jgi:hypothetical protein
MSSDKAKTWMAGTSPAMTMHGRGKRLPHLPDRHDAVSIDRQ